MSVKTSGTAASPCPQCGCAVLPCPGCGKLLKDGTILCVSCGYHLQLGRHVGPTANGSHGVNNTAAPRAHGQDADRRAPVSSGSTQDYIASLLGGNTSSQANSAAAKPSATSVGSGSAPSSPRSFRFPWPSWLTFPKRQPSAAETSAPQIFARPHPGLPPHLVAKPVVRVPANAGSEGVETDIGVYLIPTILLAIGLMAIGWFAWSGAGIPGLVIGTGLLLTVLILGTVWNAVVMNLAGWLLEFDFGPLSLGLYRLFAHSVFTAGLSLSTVLLAKLTGMPLIVWVLAVPVISFVTFSILFELEWIDAAVLYATMLFISALFHSLAFGLLHTANSVKFNFAGPQEEVAPRQGERSASEEDDDEGETAPVRAGAREIRNPEPAPSVKDSAAPKPEAAKPAEPQGEPSKSEPAKTDSPKNEPTKASAAPSENAGPPSKDE